MTKRRDPLTAAQAEIERRSRAMAEAARFSPYGRPEVPVRSVDLVTDDELAARLGQLLEETGPRLDVGATGEAYLASVHEELERMEAGERTFEPLMRILDEYDAEGTWYDNAPADLTDTVRALSPADRQRVEDLVVLADLEGDLS